MNLLADKFARIKFSKVLKKTMERQKNVLKRAVFTWTLNFLKLVEFALKKAHVVHMFQLFLITLVNPDGQFAEE